jgi:hypothetical protein
MLVLYPLGGELLWCVGWKNGLAIDWSECIGKEKHSQGQKVKHSYTAHIASDLTLTVIVGFQNCRNWHFVRNRSLFTNEAIKTVLGPEV